MLLEAHIEYLKQASQFVLIHLSETWMFLIMAFMAVLLQTSQHCTVYLECDMIG